MASGAERNGEGEGEGEGALRVWVVGVGILVTCLFMQAQRE